MVTSLSFHNSPETIPYSDFEYLFSVFGEISSMGKSLQESSDSLENRFMKFIGFRRHHLGIRGNRTRTAAAAILLLGFFIVVFAGNFSAVK
jgi:hypothetical protein